MGGFIIMNSDLCYTKKGSCSFLLIRHGYTDFNIEKKLQGWIDIPLNDLGRQQVREFASRLNNKKWDIIVSSDLLRAKQSAEIIGEVLGIPIFLYEGLRERRYGIYEGKLIDEVKRLRENNDMISIEGEVKEIFLERIKSTFEILTGVFKGRNIIIVSHGAFLKNFCKSTIGYNDDIWENSEYVEVAFNNGEWVKCK